MNAKESLVQNIDRLFFRKNGELRTEFEELYGALFTNTDKYTSVVKLLNGAHDGLSREEIEKASGIDRSALSKILSNLERSDFIIRYSKFGNKAKESIYRLVDFYTLFYYKFIDSVNTHDEEWWSHNFLSPAVESWQGQSFELLCLMHLNQIKSKLGISGIATAASSWRYVPQKTNSNSAKKDKGAQIDLIIDRADRVVNLCEMKFSVKPFRITDSYEKTLRDRMSIFQDKTKTTKSLVYTFITTYGVANIAGKSIVNSEITLNDLFVQ